MFRFKRFLLGRRLASNEIKKTKVNKVIGLSIFSSDALSSVAYATQEIMASLSSSLTSLGVVAAAGVLAHPLYRLSVPVCIGIIVLLIILGVSYSQTISAYPMGGGAYIVAKNNLGEVASLVAGASILIDFVLTVSVSVSAGVANITSAFTYFRGYEVPMTIAVIIVIAAINLRGVRDSGKTFAIPTYGFALLMIVLLGTGTIKAIFESAPTHEMVEASIRTATGISRFAILMIFLKAFSAGCTALTGIEGISNGVPAFKEPCIENASKTMIWMLTLLSVLFMGVTLLASHFGIVYVRSGDPAVISETLLSNLAKTIYGGASSGFLWFIYILTMSFTFLILVIAANTSFAGFPRLSAIMGNYKHLPKQLANQGDRLVFSNGIFILATASCFLVWLLNANTDLLIPLYAMGVFIGFTISQAGMVMHWWKRRDKEKKWQIKAAINGIGTITTAIVFMDIVVHKFKMEDGIAGVWIILLIIPALVWVFLKTHRHYVHVSSLLASSRIDKVAPHRNHVIILVSRIHHGTLEAIRYAKTIAGQSPVEALNIDLMDEYGNPSPLRNVIEADWKKYGEGIPLRIIENSFRQIVEPIIEELNRMREGEPETTFTVVLPEFITSSVFGNFLHNQTALRLKAMLLPMTNIVVISVPFHIEDRPGEMRI